MVASATKSLFQKSVAIYVVVLSTPYRVALSEQAKNRWLRSFISVLTVWIAGRSPRQSGALAPHSTTLARSAEYHAEAPQFWSAPRQRRFPMVAGEKEEGVAVRRAFQN